MRGVFTLEEFIKALASNIAILSEGVAVAFILAGIVQGVVTYIRKGIVGRKSHMALVEIRNELGHMLSLALEFLIGADILNTAISPTWEDIGQLGAIVGIRTVLNFFLVREIKAFDSFEHQEEEGEPT